MLEDAMRLLHIDLRAHDAALDFAKIYFHYRLPDIITIEPGL